MSGSINETPATRCNPRKGRIRSCELRPRTGSSANGDFPIYVTDPPTPTFTSHQGQSTIDIFATNGQASYNSVQRTLPIFGMTPHYPVPMSIHIKKAVMKSKKKRANIVLDQRSILTASTSIRTVPTFDATQMYEEIAGAIKRSISTTKTTNVEAMV